MLFANNIVFINEINKGIYYKLEQWRNNLET